MKIYLIAPKNPESFWTFDRILPSLKKRCVLPNLSLPTVAGITPREHEVALCEQNVEAVDFDTDADIVERDRRDNAAVIARGRVGNHAHQQSAGAAAQREHALRIG